MKTMALASAALIALGISARAQETFTPDGDGFIRNWLVLAPLALAGQSGAEEIINEVNSWQGCARFLRGTAPVTNLKISLTPQ